MEILKRWVRENEVTGLQGHRNNTTIFISGLGRCKGIEVGEITISFTCTKQIESDYEMKILMDKVEGLKNYIKEKVEEDTAGGQEGEIRSKDI